MPSNAPVARLTLIVLAAAAILGIAMLLPAGNLNPPAGPVAPTMRTLDEVYNAASAAGATAQCSENLPGEIRGMATGAFSGAAQNGFPVYRVEVGATSPGGAAPSFDPLTIVKDLDANSPILFDSLVQSQMISTVTIDMLDDTGALRYRIELTNARVTNIALQHTERCDLSGSQTEAVSFAYQQITYTHVPVPNTTTTWSP